jgi:hypothetical protein
MAYRHDGEPFFVYSFLVSQRLLLLISIIVFITFSYLALENTLKAFIFASLLSIIASTASAQPVDDNTVTINAAGPAITLPSEPRVMTPSDFGKFAGSYTLSNGKTLSLFVRASTKYAVIEGGPMHALVATSGNSFVAKDKQLALTIELHDHGDATGEVLIAVPGERLANGETTDKVVRFAMH